MKGEWRNTVLERKQLQYTHLGITELPVAVKTECYEIV
jgi:hypothetical protein